MIPRRMEPCDVAYFPTPRQALARSSIVVSSLLVMNSSALPLLGASYWSAA